MKQKLMIGILLAICTYSQIVLATEATDMSTTGIRQRIAPIGQVNIASDNSDKDTSADTPANTPIDTPENTSTDTLTDTSANTSTDTLANTTTTANNARSGESIYQSRCIVCHAAGLAGAPKLGDKNAWAPHVAKGKDALLDSVTHGLNAMPPMGTCMDCSQAELMAAIDYMLSKLKD